MVYGYGAARKMDLRAFILRLREDWIYCLGIVSLFQILWFFKVVIFVQDFLSGDFEKWKIL